MAVFQDTRSAMLVDVDYLRMLEHMHEELHQVRTADCEAVARRHLLAALEVAEEVSVRQEEG